MKRALLFFLLIFAQQAYSQSDKNTEWMDFIEEMYEDEPNPAYIENLYEELSYLAENPFNIQTITRQELERLPFLTAIQIENLLYYLYKYSPLVDLYELKNVEELDMQTIRYLLPFVYLGDKPAEDKLFNPKHRWSRSKQEVMLRTNATLQEKAGYWSATEEEKQASPGKYYLGEPYYLSMRYNYNYSDRLLIGLTAEKDPGEVFLNPETKGFDHYAFNLTLKDVKAIEMLSIGDYRLSFGEGLALNTNFSMGKTSDITNVNQKRSGISRHISTSESNYFSGIATAIHTGSLKTTLFYSHKKEDANVDADRIKSFVTNGYHRTENELRKKDAATVDLGGMHLEWQTDYLTVGATAVYYSFGSKTLDPDPRDYNLHYLRGKDHFNAGMDYRYRQRKWMIQGEAAMDKVGKVATIHNLLLYPLSGLDVIASFRYYDKAYNALYGQAFSESTDVQNETGCYTGLKLHRFKHWELTAYYDYFRFPFRKYGMDAPSSGNDFLMQLLYVPRKHIQMDIRYRHKKKSKNLAMGEKGETYVLPYDQHRWRYQLRYAINPSLSLKTQVHYNRYCDLKEEQRGWNITQTVSHVGRKVSIDGSLAYFNTPDWNARINIYEKNILYAFSFPMYYGVGLRYYLNLKWQVALPLTLYLKLADTHYLDRAVVSSGLEEITGKHKTDCYLLLKYKF